MFVSTLRSRKRTSINYLILFSMISYEIKKTAFPSGTQDLESLARHLGEIFSSRHM